MRRLETLYGSEVLGFYGTAVPKKTVLIIIPGNPGVVDYYDEFCRHIHENLDKKIDIITVQHLGHGGGNTNLLNNNFNLNQQIQHKIDFFDKLYEKYPPNTRFLLCGHSIGAYMALELFKARQWHRIDRVFPLFPTLHSIGNTPNGRRLTPLFLPGVRHLASCFIGVISLVHSFIPSAMRSFVSLLTNQRDPYLNITLSRLLQPRTVYNALYLAHHEMNEVLEMSQGSKNVIANHLDKIIFYYGVGDKWSPVEHYYQMKDMFPKAQIHLCNDGIPHGFVLTHSKPMARKMSDWIEPIMI